MQRIVDKNTPDYQTKPGNMQNKYLYMYSL